MKHKLIDPNKNYGGGSGHTAYESDYFRVVSMRLSEGRTTRVVFNIGSIHNVSVELEGKIEITTDEECFEQFNLEEVLTIIERSKENSYHKGRKDKAKEIRRTLGLT